MREAKCLHESNQRITKVPTTIVMLNNTEKKTPPGLVLTTALDDEGEPEAAVPELVTLVAPETLLVLVTVDDVVDVDATSYNKELAYVVHDEVAGITTGVFPGGA